MKHRIHPLTAALAIAFSAVAAQSALAQSTLNEVVVSAGRLPEATIPHQIGDAEIAARHAVTRDTAALLQDVPGVSLYGAGGVSSLPAIHGLADDRLRITVDGMDWIATCPNHMNPPLSYVAPTNLGKIKVYAGITPVSVGGDSIGGSIVAETRAPQFAAPGQGLLTKGELGTFARSNNNAVGANATATLATENFSISYSGSYAQADNYKAGKDFKSNTATGRPGHTLALDEVGSTAYESWTHLLGLAFKKDNHLFEAKIGYQDVPKQLYPNQRMDMLGNEQTRFNLRYLGQYEWGALEARTYYEEVDHYMNFGADKQMAYGSAINGMPMYSQGRTTGATVKAEIDWGANDLVRVGALYQRYRLHDWWPAAAATGNMAPGSFENINDGKRDRLGVFGEWEKRLNAQWTTSLGARFERVDSDTGDVRGYSTTGTTGYQVADAAAFNVRERSRTDNNWDFTALARYTPSNTTDIEFGLARKTRSPNLYERYTWSTWGMASIMNNFVGDGNGYVGDPDLKPETAYTASATFDWHAVDRRWELKATPFFTHVDNYIDASRIQYHHSNGNTDYLSANDKFGVLQYVNQSGRLHGLDLSGRMPLAKSSVGEFGLKGLLNYTRGENRDTGDNLYNIMPLNLKLAVTQQIGGWNNAIEFVSVQGKHNISGVRNEMRTSGYNLTHLRASYSWKNTRIDFGVENLFDKYYALPLGGAYLGQGTTMMLSTTTWGTAVPGMGRSFYAGLNVKF